MYIKAAVGSLMLAILSAPLAVSARAELSPYTGFLDGLLTQDAQGWELSNSYDTGSITNLSTSPNGDGTYWITSRYNYAHGRHSSVSVLINADNSVQCVQYYGQTCRAIYSATNNTFTLVWAGVGAVLGTASSSRSR